MKKTLIIIISVIIVVSGIIVIRTFNAEAQPQLPIINAVTVESLNQVNSLGQQLYLKTIPAFQTLEGIDRFEIITEEELLARKTNLEALLAEVEEDLQLIQNVK